VGFVYRVKFFENALNLYEESGLIESQYVKSFSLLLNTQGKRDFVFVLLVFFQKGLLLFPDMLFLEMDNNSSSDRFYGLRYDIEVSISLNMFYGE
jgi:hypothetical protein